MGRYSYNITGAMDPDNDWSHDLTEYNDDEDYEDGEEHEQGTTGFAGDDVAGAA